MKTFFKNLEQILNNKKLGSSELVNHLNKLFKSYADNIQVIEESLLLIKKKLGHFTFVSNYVNELQFTISNDNNIIDFINNYEKTESIKYEKIFNRLYKNQPDAKTVITLSRSGTLLNILRLWYNKNKKLKIIVCESRPNYEGRLLAQDLLNAGITVELITDAMMSLFVAKSDAAIIGTDSVLKNKNVINKVGSKALALFCKEHKKPFYVVTTRSKYSNKKNFNIKKEDPDEVWTNRNKDLTISNIYFEEIEKKLITKTITE